MPAYPSAADHPLPAPVLVIEDDLFMLRRMKTLLLQFGYDAAALIAAGTLADARACMSAPVALALVDLHLPDGSGIDLIAELRAKDPGLSIVVVSAWSLREEILASLRAGANGYVLKERDDLEVVLALRNVLRGGAPIDPFVARQIIEELPESANPQQPDDTGLSPREGRILRMVAEGLSNREIAEQLNLSRHTVDTHIRNIYRKLAVSSRAQATLAAHRRRLLD